MKFLKKKKLTVMVAAGLAGVSLSSVGFAGWVINAQTGDTGNVNVTFGDVTNRSYKATLDGTSDLNLAFDSDGTTGTNDVVGSGDKQDLTCTIKFQITNTLATAAAGADIFNQGLKSFTVAFSDYSVMSSLITTDNKLNLINSPVDLTKTYTISLEAGNTTSNVKDETKKTEAKYEVVHNAVGGINVTCTYTFGWGSTFGYVNPLKCSDKKNQIDGLTKLSELTKNQTVKLGIIITPVFSAK